MDKAKRDEILHFKREQRKKDPTLSDLTLVGMWMAYSVEKFILEGVWNGQGSRGHAESPGEGSQLLPNPTSQIHPTDGDSRQ